MSDVVQVDYVLTGETTATTVPIPDTALESDPDLASGITALSHSERYPFQFLTISGSGFRSADAAISVVFRVAGLEPVVVPVIAVTTTTVEVMVPALIDATGANLTGHASVQVLQFGQFGFSFSEVYDGLDIGELPQVLGPVGSVLDSYLSAALNQIDSFELGAPGDLPTSFWTALATLKIDLVALQSAVQTVINDPAATPSLATSGPGTVVLDADALALADRLVAALMLRLGEALEFSTSDTLPSGVVSMATTNCPPNTTNQWVDDFICGRQRYGQDLTAAGQRGVALGAKIEASFFLGAFGGVTSGLWGAIAPRATTAFELVWSAVSGHMSAWATANEPPSAGETLSEVGITVLEKVLGTHGMLSAVVSAVSLGQETDAIIQQQTTAPPPVSGTGLYEGSASGITTESGFGCVWQHAIALDVTLASFTGSGTLIDPYQGDIDVSGTDTITLVSGVDCDTGGDIPLHSFNGTVGGSSGKVVVSGAGLAGSASFTFSLPSGTVGVSTISGSYTLYGDGFDAPITGTLTLYKL